jgi:hypothetical protein
MADLAGIARRAKFEHWKRRTPEKKKKKLRIKTPQIPPVEKNDEVWLANRSEQSKPGVLALEKCS